MRQSREKAEREAISPVRLLADQAFSRAGGAPLLAGNSVRLLKDAQENYPAWLDTIRRAEKNIHFECYIIHEDETGREFAEALAAKAREGLRVRVIYDWLGALGAASRKLWRCMRDAGVEVRGFNPPRFDSPFGWLSRDHRKMLTVDGSIGYVTGLCVGKRWVGWPERNIEPWRDTGVEVLGPAVADIEMAFAQSWAACGEPLPEDELVERDAVPVAGKTLMRVVAGMPNTAGLYRMDYLVAALARRSLWLTDAYFVGTTTYIQSLASAARDGCDVRLLVPGSTDVPLISALSRTGYRPLLEAGVRVFEWNGSMLHAKTAVADGHWARVGSTNLNLASWMGNWELDVAVEDKRFAEEMEAMFLEDLNHSTEIVLSERKRVRATNHPEPPRTRRRSRRFRRGSAGRAAIGALGLGSAVSAAITNRRILGPAEARVMVVASVLLVVLSVVAVMWPRVVTIPLAVIGVWTAAALLIRSYRLHREGSSAEQQSAQARTILSQSGPLPATPAREGTHADSNK
ncbi:MAG TPA: phospholipase D-like domain-containing protein [Pyrinomonadaceae bacterium]|nr:phospholipase D-like domain-containing protein [Pyrinomonadaceae bacterium]